MRPVQQSGSPPGKGPDLEQLAGGKECNGVIPPADGVAGCLSQNPGSARPWDDAKVLLAPAGHHPGKYRIAQQHRESGLGRGAFGGWYQLSLRLARRWVEPIQGVAGLDDECPAVLTPRNLARWAGVLG